MNNHLLALKTYLCPRFEGAILFPDCVRISVVNIEPEDFTHIANTPMPCDVLMRTTGYSITITIKPKED